jgi:hypothetical protein
MAKVWRQQKSSETRHPNAILLVSEFGGDVDILGSESKPQDLIAVQKEAIDIQGVHIGNFDGKRCLFALSLFNMEQENRDNHTLLDSEQGHIPFRMSTGG